MSMNAQCRRDEGFIFEDFHKPLKWKAPCLQSEPQFTEPRPFLSLAMSNGVLYLSSCEVREKTMRREKVLHLWLVVLDFCPACG